MNKKRCQSIADNLYDKLVAIRMELTRDYPYGRYLNEKLSSIIWDANVLKQEFDNLPNFRVRTRLMKTKWGVCNISSMTVTLNVTLITKREDLIDYVIIHELSHFKHMNHSAAFWDEVGRHYPDYKRARKELNA